MHDVIFRNHILAGLCVLVGGCQTLPAPVSDNTLPPVRFLLTFDDGPSAEAGFNTTRQILHTLETNPVQPGVKALFFVQTRNAGGGASPIGQQLLRFKYATGHVLGLHSGTERGHIRHTLMPAGELAQSLLHGRQDLRRIAGDEALLVRPTFWGYNDLTVEQYTAHGFRMLLTDVNSRDGIWLHSLFGMEKRLYKSLQQARKAIDRGELPVHQGIIPLVVTFHDLNPITAFRLGSYMKLLTEAALAAGLRVADMPFYDNRDEILAVATLRAETPESLARRAQRGRPLARTTSAPTTTAALGADSAIAVH